jgi:hypothetical protein
LSKYTVVERAMMIEDGRETLSGEWRGDSEWPLVASVASGPVGFRVSGLGVRV